jgi:hypothetical protein
VNSLVYGSDNSCMLDALRQLGRRARGFALIDDRTSNTELDLLARAGVREICLNFVGLAVPDPLIIRQRFQNAGRIPEREPLAIPGPKQESASG